MSVVAAKRIHLTLVVEGVHDAIALVRAGRTPEDLAGEFDSTHDSATAKTPYSLVKAVTGMSVVAAKRSTPMATMTGLLPAVCLARTRGCF